MSKMPNPYVCDKDGCGAIKRDVNHWWVVTYSNGDYLFQIMTWERGKVEQLIDLEGFTHHFCGQPHALEFVSEIMGRITKQERDKEAEA